MKTVLTILCTLLSSNMIYSCTCSNWLLDLPIQEMGWTQSETGGTKISDLIFRGILIEGYETTEKIRGGYLNEYEEFKIELVFKVIDSYKGNIGDTIIVRTNKGQDACGFTAPQNSECLIFAKHFANGYYFTTSSECCKSIAKSWEEKRYNNYIQFLESITNMIDGEYEFKQTAFYRHGDYQQGHDTLDLITYEIKNGKFNGQWKITDRMGRVLEVGNYKDGLKSGRWVVASYFAENASKEGWSDKTERIEYKEGKPIKSYLEIRDYIHDYENIENGIRKLLSIQRSEKTWEYK